jgi:uncharacterized protein (DUF58 family)
MRTYIPILVILIVLAAFMRDDFALTLIYLFLGASVIGMWWSRKSISQVGHRRKFTDRAFLGEKVDVEISIHNGGWLPLVWTRIEDALPVGLSTSPAFERVTALGPKGEAKFQYTLEARKRGYYPLGPLFVSTGDILGLSNPLRTQMPAQYLTVYPRIVALKSIQIPSRSPQGKLRHTQPIFEDPTRVFGKREYVAGDSLRRVDWKSTATTGRLQVKLFKPAISLETLIFLNLNAEDYHYRTRIDSTELAVVIAASMASWVAGKRQTVGLHVNGSDPLKPGSPPQAIPPRKGQAHLMRILDLLARIETTQESPLASIIQRERFHLSWGTTLIVITGEAGDDLLDELYQARRAGQNALLILAGPVTDEREVTRRADRFGIPVIPILNERGLDIWRE